MLSDLFGRFCIHSALTVVLGTAFGDDGLVRVCAPAVCSRTDCTLWTKLLYVLDMHMGACTRDPKYWLTTCRSPDGRLQRWAARAWVGEARCYWWACLLLHLSRLFEFVLACVAFMCCWRADWLVKVLSHVGHFKLCTELKCWFNPSELLHVLLQCWQGKFMTLLRNLSFWTGRNQQQYTWQERERSSWSFQLLRTAPLSMRCSCSVCPLFAIRRPLLSH